MSTVHTNAAHWNFYPIREQFFSVCINKRQRKFSVKKLSVLLGLPLLLSLFGCRADEKSPSPVPASDAILIDVRSVEEFNAGYVEGAVNIPLDVIDSEISKVVPDKNTPVQLYCRSGRRSGMAMEKMRQKGYTNVSNLGGYKEAQQKLNRRLKER